MKKPQPAKANAAIYYLPEGYSTGGKNIMGIHAASEGFLRGFARHADIEMVYCAVEDDAAALAFQKTIAAEGRSLPIKAYSIFRPEVLAEPGCVYLPGPGLSEFAWRRRLVDQRSYSLCGVTHTTATVAVMDAIADFVTAPIQEWDALICTSRAVHGMVRRLLDDQIAYLKDRLGASAFTLPRIEVIPLGIDTQAFAEDSSARERWRSRLGVAEDDVVILFFGRLSFHAKAHPIPMYQALSIAAAKSKCRVHLIHAGWFPSEEHEEAYRVAGKDICPDVNLIFVDGRDTEVRRTIWSAADIFTSLADNIQETFGLTPIEAMAAGLPVVVSDWDGYRDTVRDGVDGFRVPTVMAPAPLGGDLAYQHATGGLNYDNYIGRTAQFVAVDIEACASAYAKLANDAALRRSMGEAGRRQVKSKYDWRVVIAEYQRLWADLAVLRASAKRAPMPAPAGLFRPARPDPFRAFADYPSSHLRPNDMLSLMDASESWFKIVRGSPLIVYADEALPTEAECRQMMALIESGTRRACDIVASFPDQRQGIVFRGLVWLAKFGLARIVSA